MTDFTIHYSEKALRALRYLACMGFASAVLLPPFAFQNTWPSIELSDVLLLPMVVLLLTPLTTKKITLSLPKPLKNSALLWTLFILLTIVSIGINQRFNEVRDWFEVLKYIKFSVFTIAFMIASSLSMYARLILWSVAALIVFNILHYTDFLGFNTYVEPFYAPNVHLDVFGLDSKGNPSTRRAIGTMGNPNMNGQLFVFMTFLLMVLRSRFRHKGIDLLVLASIAGVVMCQSRTTAMGLFLLILLSLLLGREFRLRSLGYLGAMVIYWVISAYSGNVYLSSLGNQAALESASIGRLVQWQRIWEAMPGNYFFGHAPAKEYFEAHGIYSESEYFLILFRYGFVGLLTYLLFMVSIALPGIFMRPKQSFLIIMPVLLWALAAVTSNPLHSNKLAIVIAFTIGFVFSLVYGQSPTFEVDGSRAG